MQGDVLIAEGKTIQVNNQIPIWQDVHEFQRQIASCQSHLHQDLETCEDCLLHLERSVALYRGDFLTGLNLPDCPEFDEWQYLERENFRAAFAQALCGLVKAYETRQEWEKALQHARHWVTLDRLNEAAQRTLINLYARSGQRSAALHQYEALTHLLQEELGQPPEEETTALYKRIQAREVTGKNPPRSQRHHPSNHTQGNETLLKTKLFIPPIRVDRVPRPRLLELLNAGSQRALTLISAPAGFGKTTLLAHWTTQTELPIAWYSLDENDNDPTRFVSYLIAALDSIIPTIGEQFQGTYQSLQPSIQPVLVGLMNDLTTVPEPFVLVLDDYQFIHSPVVHQGMAFLVDKIPACMHLVIATRTDPPLPLARLRARDQLVEIRANDLRFTQEESAGFLHQVMSLDLTGDDVLALETRTEGWIAGLQMAALAIRAIGNLKQVTGVEASSTQKEISGFIQDFSGSHRYILDYLGEEVLSRCPAEIRRFLLQTSLLERFSGPLCVAVTGIGESEAILETLEKENIFLVPLDNTRSWYRYHHLFAELLRYQLGESLLRIMEGTRRVDDTRAAAHPGGGLA